MAHDDNDMPLVANITDIVVRHYILNLTCDFEKKIFSGNAVLFLEPVESDDKPSRAVIKPQCSCCCYPSNGTESSNITNSVQGSPTDTLKTGFETHNYNSLCDTLFTCAESEVNLKKLITNEGYLYINEETNKDSDSEGNWHVKKLKNKESEKSVSTRDEFTCILDCCQLNIKSVEEVDIDVDKFMLERFSHETLEFSSTCDLNFLVDKWSLQIWKEGIYCQFCFPKFIRIHYETVPEGNSLMWVKDQDGRPAVFTYGAWINNRALFPCQEPPAAMATWSAIIVTCESSVVLMSGDSEPVIYNSIGFLHYFYCTKSVLPMATLSLAVGFWKGEKIVNQKCIQDSKPSNVSFRIFASSSIFEKVKEQFSNYLVRSVEVAVSYLGEYPFPRIDVLIVPRGFGSLGMASPNLIFLSQSLLAGDGSMCIRLAHEVAHAWFGLLIGSLDWTEEWLSEGFATFMEEFIHVKVACMSPEESKHFLELRSYLKLKTLQAEIENVDPELLKLRPNEGEVVTANIDGKEAIVVKNGQNPEKAFIQVHYVKGFFILKHLSDTVGLWNFIDFLKLYVDKYRGQLVESKQVFEMFIETFPLVCETAGITLDGLISHWLHNSELPKEILATHPSASNTLFKTVLNEAKCWKETNKALLKQKSFSRKRKKYSFENYIALTPIQLTLLLEELLEENKMSVTVMRKVEQTYDLNNANADVRHRWCELIVKHRYTPGYACLRQFLQEELAMGIYLHSELIFSGIPSHKAIVEESLKCVLTEMEPNQVTSIKQMLENSSH